MYNFGLEFRYIVIKKTGKVATTIQGGETIITDMLLYTMGRTAQTHALGLPLAGVEIDTAGQIKVDECYRTAALDGVNRL